MKILSKTNERQNSEATESYELNANEATTKVHMKSLSNIKLSNEDLKGNIENFIGWTQIPTGLTSPLQVNGEYAKGSYQIPLATTEGALVASYSRGCKVISASGGANVLITQEGIQRSPLFKFSTLREVKKFKLWLTDNFLQFQFLTTKSSNYAHLKDMNVLIEGNVAIVTFEYLTREAAGQNMVTICTQAICEIILMDCPIKPLEWYIEGNFSGDKKSTSKSLSHVRGKRVSAEVLINKVHLTNILKTTASKMVDYWQSSTLAAIQSGTIGAQGHYANGLAALYLSTGQDVACVAESAIGITRMEKESNGSLYACVTLPSIIVGTIGGGTWLPTQNAFLKAMNCTGNNSSKALAEITASLALAGELSIAAALAEGHFTRAHKALGRKSNKK